MDLGLRVDVVIIALSVLSISAESVLRGEETLECDVVLSREGEDAGEEWLEMGVGGSGIG